MKYTRYFQKWRLSWVRHVVRMLPGHIPGKVPWVCPTRRRPKVRPKTLWTGCGVPLAWELFGIPPEDLAQVSEERKVWTSMLRLLHPRHTHTQTNSGLSDKYWMDGHTNYFYNQLKIKWLLEIFDDKISSFKSALVLLTSSFFWVNFLKSTQLSCPFFDIYKFRWKRKISCTSHQNIFKKSVYRKQRGNKVKFLFF